MESDFGPHWSLLLLLLPLIMRLKWDAALIKSGYEVQHMIHTLVTAGAYLIVSFIVWWWGPAQYWLQPFLFGTSIFFFCFDYLLNLARHLSLGYVDQGLDGKSSETDKLYKSLDWWIILFGKCLILLFGFSIYFYWSYTNIKI